MGQFFSKSAYLIQALGRAPQCDVAPSLWSKLWNSKILERHKTVWWIILSNVLPIHYASIVLPLNVVHAVFGWDLPPIEWIKINYDARRGRETMCMLGVAYDHLGAFVWVAVNNFPFSAPLITEAVACLLAVETSVALGYNFVIVESESEVGINAIRGLSPRSKIDSYISNCRSTAKLLSGYDFAKIYQLCNFVADNVCVNSAAKPAISTPVTGLCTSPLPIIKWQPPPENKFKLNVDTALDSSRSKIGTGVIVWNSAGHGSNV
uniref:RNase H type-1 domain-containing protein n=1 Tax=Cannabis sativa TaxID=3483 RepID=A0A803QGV6_CANSA